MSGSCGWSLTFRCEKRSARCPSRKPACGVCVLGHAATNSPDPRVVQVLRKSQVGRAGESLTVRVLAGSPRNDRTARGSGHAGVKKAQKRSGIVPKPPLYRLDTSCGKVPEFVLLPAEKRGQGKISQSRKCQAITPLYLTALGRCPLLASSQSQILARHLLGQAARL